VDGEDARGVLARSPWVLLEGEPYRLVPYGNERSEDGRDYFSDPCHLCGALPHQYHTDDCRLGAGSLYQRPARCRDCGCGMGALHRLNCGIEQCPRCGGQYSSCDCNGSEDEDEDEEPESSNEYED